MRLACFVSGKGTVYEKIYETDPTKRYAVFSNRPECEGVSKARKHGVPVAILDSGKHFREMSGVQSIPRKGAARDRYDMAAATLVEQEIGVPDLICLTGYDLWLGDQFVDRYFTRILNVHPADTTKPYKGLGWVPIAKAILAGEPSVKTTVFIVDKSDDEGPVLIQSASLPLSSWDNEVSNIRRFAERVKAGSIGEFVEAAERSYQDMRNTLKTVSVTIQDALKEKGDWQIFPFAVHALVGKGRAAIDDNRKIYIDGIEMPKEGYQVDEFGLAERIQRWV